MKNRKFILGKIAKSIKEAGCEAFVEQYAEKCRQCGKSETCLGLSGLCTECIAKASAHEPLKILPYERIAYGNNHWSPEGVVIGERMYNNDEIMEILQKHKEEEDKRYQACQRCGDRYLENKAHDMVECGLHENPVVNGGYACGATAYSSTPYITGIKILSTCGHGREVKMCDRCIDELVRFLGRKD